MIDIREFLPEVYLEAAGCPEAVALNALRNALREFCQRSEAWVKTFDPIYLYANVADYEPDYETGTELARVLVVKYKGIPLGIATRQEMDDSIAAWETATGTSPSNIIPSRRIFRVHPIPSENVADPITLRVALQPTHTAQTCEEDLLNWREAIAGGALARLKVIPGKEWSDRESAAAYRQLFDSGIGDAMAAVTRGYAKRSLRVRPRSFV